MKVRDLLERVLWTAVAAAFSSPAVAALVAALVGADLGAAKMALATAAGAALAAAVNAVLVIARWRLSVLPNPGAGLPGLPIDNTSWPLGNGMVRVGPGTVEQVQVRSRPPGR